VKQYLLKQNQSKNSRIAGLGVFMSASSLRKLVVCATAVFVLVAVFILMIVPYRNAIAADPHDAKLSARKGSAQAEFHITQTVINPNPGAFTATTVPKHILVDMSMEPMTWRKAFRVTGGSPGRIEAQDLDHFDSLAPDYWNDSEVRVLRAQNGRLIQVFDGRVQRYHQGHWSGVGGGLVPPALNSIELRTEPWARPGTSWWFSLVTIDRAGRASARSAIARIDDPLKSDRSVKMPDISWVPQPNLDPRQSSRSPSPSSPSPPTAFRASLDPTTGIIRFSWSHAATDIAGYRLERTFVDPDTHEGHYLALTTDNGGNRFTAKSGDLLMLTRQRDAFSKADYSPRVYNASEASPPNYQPFVGDGELEPLPFQLVHHPSNLPNGVADAGQTSLRFSPPAGVVTQLRTYNHSGTAQNWYRILRPQDTYVVELLARQEGLTQREIRFRFNGPLANKIAPIVFKATPDWQLFRAEFKVPELLTSDHVGQMVLEMEGPGTVWLDNWRVYEKKEGLKRWDPADQQALRESGMAFIRTHDTCKSDGYSLSDLLGHPHTGLTSGKQVFSRGNLSALLAEMRDFQVNPWLQLEPTLNQDELAHLVEYLAAPYDPAVDTPQTKPWAWRRVQHGQEQPYSNTFSRLLVEFGNETWNSIMPFNLSGWTMTDATNGKNYSSGEVYGLLQEYAIQAMKRSPYWTEEMEQKTEFVLGGWAINRFGYEAAALSPSSRHVLIADYIGGWDANEGPASDSTTALQQTLDYAAQSARPNAIARRQERDSLNRAGAKPLAIGSYEAGPGYNLNGLNGVAMTNELVEFESRTMKSLAAGTATLDSFLSLAEQGAQLQNFFTFSRNRHYWTSHAELINGGHAYPSWQALSLYNRRATGDFLKVLTPQVPSHQSEALGRRAAVEIPDIAVYATRTQDQLAVFVLSRSLKEFIPVKLHLPLESARAVRLHQLTGKPAAHNLDRENISPQTRTLGALSSGGLFELNAKNGADARGMPPASIYLYVFEGARFKDDAPQALIHLEPGQTAQASGLPVQFRVAFTDPIAAFNPTDVAMSGSAEPQHLSITEVPGSYGMEFTVSVTDTLREGTITLALHDDFRIGDQHRAKGNVSIQQKVDIQQNEPSQQKLEQPTQSIELKLPTGMDLPLLAWDFSVDQQHDYGGRPVEPSTRFPALKPTALSASHPDLLGDNPHYNNDGAGTWAQSMSGDQTYAYHLTLKPVAQHGVDIRRVKVGLFAQQTAENEWLQASLEIWQKGQRVAAVPFVSDSPIRTRSLEPGAGIAATADVSGIAALQGLTQPVELRLVLFGLSKGGVFGIGKLGRGIDDLVITGRLTQ
jgi:hypothetical protein